MVAGKRKKKKRKNAGGRAAAVLTGLLTIMAVSLVLRWSGVLSPDGRAFKGFRLEVLNGTGEQGLAMETATSLRRRGIDVLLVGDAKSYDFSETLLIDRKGDRGRVEKLGKLIGCGRVLQQVQERPMVDATLIIGDDYGRMRFENGS